MQTQNNFERIKQEGYKLFMKCFEDVSNSTYGIYMQMARNQSAKTFLGQGTLRSLTSRLVTCLLNVF